MDKLLEQLAALEKRAADKLAEITDDTDAKSARAIEKDHAGIVEEISEMKRKIDEVKTAARAETFDHDALTRAADKSARDALVSERKRVAEIRSMARDVKNEALGDALIDEGASVEEARKRFWADVVKTQEPEVDNKTRAQVGKEDAEKRAEGIENAILHRANASVELTDSGRQFRGMTILEMARDHLERAGVSTRGMSRGELAAAALAQRSGGMMSTSDFPVILGNVVNTTLRSGYQAAPQTFRPLVRVVSVPDFKSVHRAQLGEAPQFEKVNEHGEFKRGSMGEAKESYAIATYGKVVAITRQTLINDDMNAFSRIPMAFGVQAAQLESDLVWAQIVGNPAMGDTVALFHDDHSNLAATSVKLSAATAVTAISAARAAMAKQTGLDGKTVLNIQPAYLICPVGVSAEAEKIIYGQIAAPKAGDVTPASIRQLTPISEARLDNGFINPATGAAVAGSANAWYLASTPGLIDTVELAYLEGNQGVYTETRMGFEVDGMEIKVRLDAAAKAIDHRGFYKNAGA